MVQNAETLSETRPLGQIQADLFCDACGYNLYSQAVMRDPHMGILVCRCPECGKYSPAGVASDAANRWRYALGVWLLILRVLAISGLLISATVLMGVLPYALSEEMVQRWEYYGYTYTYMHQPWDEAVLITRTAYAVAAVAVGFAAGLVLSVGLYHWPRRFYRWALLTPAVVLVMAGAIWHLDYRDRPQKLFSPIASRQTTIENYLKADPQLRQSLQQLSMPGGSPDAPVDVAKLTEIRRQEITAKLNETRPLPSPAAHMTLLAGLTTLGMFVTTLFGRPITRGVLRMLLPSRALQSLAILWFVDGKAPPRTYSSSTR